MTDRVAIVTGASGGIGHAVAVRLAQAGMSVAVHYAGNRDRAQAVVDEIVAAGGRAIVVAADVADEAQVAALFDEVEAEFGGVDVVVNTAGIMLLSPLTELNLDDFDRMHRTNVRGTFVVSQQAARRVREGGAIINFSTSVTKLALPDLHRLRRHQGRGRRDDADPGQGDARPRRHRQRRRARPDRHAAVPRRQAAAGRSTPAQACPPLERLGEPDDIAEAVAFLAGPARWVNGQIIYANGGVI